MSHPNVSTQYVPATAGGKRAATIAEADAFGYPREAVELTQAERAPRPIDDALGYSVDRLDRVDHMLGYLTDTITDLTNRLEAVLTDGTPATYPTMETLAGDPSPEDRRSTIARRIHALGDRADTVASRVADQRDRLVGILDALEV